LEASTAPGLKTSREPVNTSGEDYDLLIRVIGRFDPIYTVAHVMAEVSNLTDLTGAERLAARRILKESLATLREPEMPSARAAQGPLYEALGLTDAAIAAVAREHKCAVLTDDLNLYLTLARQGVKAYNFTHLRAQNWGL
jgi:predicted nucleic acid-binding protein